MMRMMPGMLNGLRLSQSADGQDTNHKQDRQNLEDALAHDRSVIIFGVMLMNSSKTCQAVGMTVTHG
jgi:hypothetical protein